MLNTAKSGFVRMRNPEKSGRACKFKLFFRIFCQFRQKKMIVYQQSVEKAEKTIRKKAEIGTTTLFLGGGTFDSFLMNLWSILDKFSINFE